MMKETSTHQIKLSVRDTRMSEEMEENEVAGRPIKNVVLTERTMCSPQESEREKGAFLRVPDANAKRHDTFFYHGMR